MELDKLEKLAVDQFPANSPVNYPYLAFPLYE
jgi:hypothetical protein